MAGYLLMHESQLAPRKADGIRPNPQRIGFLDYLRELRQEVFPFGSGQKLLVLGVEDVLLAAAGNRATTMSWLHRVMTARASELEHVGGWVQIVFRRKLVRADDFWFEHGQERISLRRLFDSPQRQVDRSGSEFYILGFNLT